MRRAVGYLVQSQREDGSWVPLWFGNPWSADQLNPVVGTSRVLRCGELLPEEARRRGADWLRSAQHPDGGFGSIEETALAVEALADDGEAVERGCRWLAEKTADGTRFDPAPIGLYFARLWYSEKLYPLIFTVSALKQWRE